MKRQVVGAYSVCVYHKVGVCASLIDAVFDVTLFATTNAAADGVDFVDVVVLLFCTYFIAITVRVLK